MSDRIISFVLEKLEDESIPLRIEILNSLKNLIPDKQDIELVEKLIIDLRKVEEDQHQLKLKHL